MPLEQQLRSLLSSGWLGLALYVVAVVVVVGSSAVGPFGDRVCRAVVLVVDVDVDVAL